MNHTGCLLALLALLLVGCATTEAPPSARAIVLYPPPPERPRVAYLTSFSTSRDVEPGRSALDVFLGEEEAPAERISKPYGVAARDGVVYVCDTMAPSIVKFDFRARRFSRFGTEGLGALRKPVNIVLDAGGNKYVADPLRRQVVVFGPDDRFVRAYDVPPPARVVDVAVYGDRVYALDNDKDCRVVVFDRQSGKVVATFGGPGPDPGQFVRPNGLAVDGEGNLYVSDTINCRIQKLTPEGKPLWERGEPGRRLGQFARPRGIAVGPNGIVYVVDGAMELVQMYDTEGRLLMRFGGPGERPGDLVLPADVAVDTTSIPLFARYAPPGFRIEYLLFVTSQYGPRQINVYAFGQMGAAGEMGP